MKVVHLLGYIKKSKVIHLSVLNYVKVRCIRFLQRGVTTNNVQQAFSVLPGSTEPKDPVRDNSYHNSGHQLSLLN